MLDDCSYDSDGNVSRDRNWAIDWQNSHTLGVDWFNCSCAHSQPLNGNRKAHWGHGAATEQVANSTAVPEPGVLAMLAICLVLLAGGRWGRVR